MINRTEKDSTFFENLIIEINDQMKARAVIAKYIPSKPLVIEQENKVGFEGNITSIKLFDEINPNLGDFVVPFCFTEVYSLCNGDPYDCGGAVCGFGTRTTCIYSGGGGGSSGGSGTSGGGPGGGTSGGASGGSGSGGTGSSSPPNNNPNNNLNNVNTIIVPPAQWDDALWNEFKNDLSPEQSQFLSPGLQNVYVLNALETKVKAYLRLNEYVEESKDFMSWAITYLDNHLNVDFEYLLNNRTEYNTSTNDIDNNTEGNYDETVYSNFNPLQDTWSNISSVIPVNKFVGWGYPNVKQNCMDYAKAQIKKMGFQISNYSAIGQTFQIYTTQSGVNQTKLNQGLSYLKYALSNGIPVIVGIDDAPGSPNAATDNSTDHFVVIVGMGTNNNGNYFQFYDNASGNSNQGANPLNLLYFNPTTNQISGTSQCSGYVNCCTTHNYILTQIRKSKI